MLPSLFILSVSTIFQSRPLLVHSSHHYYLFLPPSDVTIIPSTAATLTYGDSFLLNCTLSLQPLNGAATYVWQNNGTVLSNQNASTLLIPIVTTSHRGTYTCSVQLHGVTVSSPSGVLLSVFGRLLVGGILISSLCVCIIFFSTSAHSHSYQSSCHRNKCHP